jgi:hypothetical protein
MRYLSAFIALFALGTLISIPAQAGEYKFTTSVQTPDIKIASITISASEKVMGENELYDQTDVESLKRSLYKMVSNNLKNKELMDPQGAKLEITLVEITPNRPTLAAMTKRSGLSYQSFGIGGAELDARFVAQDGTDIGSMHFRWRQTQLDQFSQGQSTWYDAKQGFLKFANRLVKELRAPASS